MVHAALVGARQRLADLFEDLHRVRGFKPPDPKEPIGEVLAIEELHDQVGRSVGQLCEVEDVDDVGAFELPGDRRLAPETLEQGWIARDGLGVHDLDRTAHPRRTALALINRGHAPDADDPVDVVGAERMADQGLWGRVDLGAGLDGHRGRDAVVRNETIPNRARGVQHGRYCRMVHPARVGSVLAWLKLQGPRFKPLSRVGTLLRLGLLRSCQGQNDGER